MNYCWSACTLHRAELHQDVNKGKNALQCWSMLTQLERTSSLCWYWGSGQSPCAFLSKRYAKTAIQKQQPSLNDRSHLRIFEEHMRLLDRKYSAKITNNLQRLQTASHTPDFPSRTQKSLMMTARSATIPMKLWTVHWQRSRRQLRIICYSWRRCTVVALARRPKYRIYSHIEQTFFSLKTEAKLGTRLLCGVNFMNTFSRWAKMW